MQGRRADRRSLMLTAAALCLCGCGSAKKTPPDPFAFRDDVLTNAKTDAGQFDLTFKDVTGKTIQIKDYRGKKNVVLVVTRGSVGGYSCNYCYAQTNRLIANFSEFARRDAEIVLVVPGNAELAIRFQKGATPQGASPESPPFPIVLDEKLEAVDRLGIRHELAKPSTYILDKEGRVRFAYVGSSLTDRPSLKAMLQQLDLINGEAS